jgi:two-component system, OmpR family, phosphate regulon sensor histidine kinase PhoR
MERQGHILVVDDEKGMREGCRRVLISEGARVAVAADPEAGLELVNANSFDLALIDVKMPGMGGIELVRRLQQIDPTLVSVMITGYATLETAIEATRNGAYDFLPKPFTPDELMAKVNKGLERRWLMLEAKRLRQERERRLLEISAEKSRLLTIINCMQDGVLVTNRDGQLVLHNPAARAMLQLHADNSSPQPLESCVPLPEIAALVDSALSAAAPEGMLSHEVVGPDGQQTLMANVAAVRDERAETIGAVTVLRDITSLKRLERAKSQFVGMVAHELAAPLGAIKGYLDLLISGAAGDDPEQRRQMLERSRDRASALLELIDDLLQDSQLEAGHVSRRFESVCLPEVVSDAWEVVRPQAEERGIECSHRLPPDIPQVLADRGDMVRLFTNLLSNAIKYNREGGSIRLHARTDSNYLEVDVVDTGLGIPEESLGRLFEQFYRVKSPETRSITGTGLGLSIVKRILDAHHGYIKVESRPGVGSSFAVYLPTVDARPSLGGDGH